jgi:hypothetical protein
MANPFWNALFGPPVQTISDAAAAERQVEEYLRGLTARPSQDADAYIPFALDKPAAIAAYTKWLNSLSMAPGLLKRTADLGALNPVYVPFWLVNSMTYTSYHGERGENHTETERFTDAQGASQTRQVTKTRWSPVSGEHRYHFDGLALSATTLPDAHAALLAPRDLKNHPNLRAYDAAAVKDTPVHPLHVDPRSGFNQARTQMEGKIKEMIQKEIGGHQQKVNSMTTRHVGVAMKKVLVPGYEGSYRFRGKEYKIVINGATGETTGDYPVSAGKVLLIVGGVLVAFAVIVGLIIFFVMKH